MASKYASHLRAQNQMESDRSDQVKNIAGGFVFALDVWGRLERFLILGSDAPTYYQTARALTRENAAVVNEAWATDPRRTCNEICAVSMDARAPKNDPAIFALALGAVHSDVVARQAALGGVPYVCRTATHLFQFVNFCDQLGKGWGRGMKRAVSQWYESKTPDQVAYQAIKYRQREGYTHERLLDLSHPRGKENGPIYQWIVGNADQKPDKFRYIDLPPVISRFEAVQRGEMLDIPSEISKLPWEAFRTEDLNKPDLWRALLPTMGLTALVRNLGKMTSIGVITDQAKELPTILNRLRNPEQIAQSRMHPLQFLTAMKVYSQGHGDKGSLRWNPVQNLVRALNDAFYLAFKSVVPTGERILLALDVSSSMTHQTIAGSSFNSREGAAALALVTATVEDRVQIVGFSATRHNGRYSYGHDSNLIVPLPIGAGQRLDDVIKIMEDVPFGSTDCSLPMEYAIQQKLEIDKFVIFTDNETYAGKRHPYVALQDYRKQSGIDAKLIVVGMTSTGFTIADPRDPGMLDVVGFDSAVPNLISQF